MTVRRARLAGSQAGGRAMALAGTVIASVVLTGFPASPAAAEGRPLSPRPHSPPSLSARAAIVVESSSGEVVFERAAHERRAIASTTKLMTALLARERIGLDDRLAAAPYIAEGVESRLDLRPGERLLVRDLLTALLLPSANDAAATLAEGISGSQAAFVRAMNRRAQQLGLRDTHYSNPVGLDAVGNYSTAADLVKLARRLRRDAFLRRTVDRPQALLRSGDTPRTVLNRNMLVRSDATFNGVKTGHTLRAGYVVVGSATRGGITLLSAVLGEPSEAARDADTRALMRYGFTRVERVEPLRAGQLMRRVRVADQRERVALVAATGVRRTIMRGQRLTLAIKGPMEIRGPLSARTPVGSVLVRHGGRTIARAPLVTTAAVPAPTLGERLAYDLEFTLVALAAGAAGMGALMVLRRRGRRRRARKPDEIARATHA